MKEWHKDALTVEAGTGQKPGTMPVVGSIKENVITVDAVGGIDILKSCNKAAIIFHWFAALFIGAPDTVINPKGIGNTKWE